MKKFLIVLLCAVLLFTLVACDKQSTNQPDDKPSVNTNSTDDKKTDSSTDDKKTDSSSEKASGNKVFKLTRAKGVTSFVDPRVVVVCWGDSITQGMAMSPGFTYPQQLQDGIGSQYRVLNAGVPGETSDAILSRANAVEICFTKDVTFAKGERKSAMDCKMFKLVGADAPLTYRGFGNQLSLSDVIIDGAPYTIEYEKGESYEQSIFHLTRKDVSSALTIRAGTKVKFNYSPQYEKVHCNVILFGANDGNQGVEALIAKYKKLTALNENYIVIVPFYGTDYSKEFEKAFGDKALNVREYFMNQAHKDYGGELTSSDISCIKDGLIPSFYTYKGNRGDCHLNEKGYKVLGDQVYKKGVELGYWKQQ